MELDIRDYLTIGILYISRNIVEDNMFEDVMSIVCFLLILICVFSTIRNTIIGCKYKKLIDAIGAHKIWCAKNNVTPLVTYSDLKEYYTVFFDFTKWKYEDIIEKNKYNLIKSYFVNR